MARPLRFEMEGGVYYIFSRSIERRHLFRDRKDFLKFISILKEAKERFGFLIYSYALIRDSYYIVLETPLSNLSRAMHFLNTFYTVYYNRKYGKSGPLFRGRYKSYIVDKEEFLIELTRYVHLIPYLMRESKRPQRYPYSSLGEYLHPKKEGFVETTTVLKSFSKRKGDARKKYKEFIEEGIRGKIVDPLEMVVARTVIGSEEFVKELKKMLKNGEGKILINKFIEKEKVIDTFCKFFRVRFAEIKKRKKNDLRRQGLMYILNKKSGLKLKEIGEIFGIGYSAVSQDIKKFKNALENDKELLRYFRVLEERLSRIR